MGPVSLPSGDGTLVGDYLTGTSDANFALVYVHGFGGSRGGEKAAAIRAECDRRGWTFAAFDFRGHGESSGTMHDLTADALIEDLCTVRDFLAGRGHARFGLVGSSMGGFAAAWFALRYPDTVLGCVFIAPAFGFLDRRWDQLTSAEREEWQRTDRLRVTNDWVDVEVGYGLMAQHARFRPDALASGFRTPALIVHGLMDDVVPIEDCLDFMRRAAYPGIELRLLKDGDHRLTAYKDEIAAETGRFFAKWLRS